MATFGDLNLDEEAKLQSGSQKLPVETYTSVLFGFILRTILKVLCVGNRTKSAIESVLMETLIQETESRTF